jgi:hypothetical protein
MLGVSGRPVRDASRGQHNVLQLILEDTTREELGWTYVKKGDP